MFGGCYEEKKSRFALRMHMVSGFGFLYLYLYFSYLAVVWYGKSKACSDVMGCDGMTGSIQS